MNDINSVSHSLPTCDVCITSRKLEKLQRKSCKSDIYIVKTYGFDDIINTVFST